MKDYADIIVIVARQWQSEIRYKILPLPPEAKIVTGRPHDDAVLHFMETQHGIEIIPTPDGKDVAGYNVVDDKKFAWFMLRWS